jgi:hypothetical protein
MHRGLVLTSICLAAGCARAPVDAGRFGDAVRADMTAQIIDPAPPARGIPPSEGVRRALMLQRYETDTGRKPEDVGASKR